MIVYLHAEYQGGDNGTSHVLNNNPLIKNMYTESTDDDAIILAMQVTKDTNWTGTDVKSIKYEYNADKAPVQISDLNELVDIVVAGNAGVKIDSANLSIVGQSNGGTAVYDILTRYPGKYVRAAVGGAAITEALNVGDTSLKIYQGGFDIFFDEPEIAAFASSLEGDVEYINLRAEDHNVWNRGFNRELCLWLIGQ
jgi:predicted peptidase